MNQFVRHIAPVEIPIDDIWEDAYQRFETSEQEVTKFLKRYRQLGLDTLPRDARIAEIFCGRGNGLVALAKLGFQNLEGFDISERLLRQYEGKAALHLADCRQLPSPDASFDAVIVQGGLHHLVDLPSDLEQVCREVHRVLKPDAHFFIVEPWMTPFLRCVHTFVGIPWVRKLWKKADALETMIERERKTYERWLAIPDSILKILEYHFSPVRRRVAYGKLLWVGRPKASSANGETDS